MASINFLYRSIKGEAPLNIRLLFRYNEKDLSFGAKSKFVVSKEYWNKQHKQKRPKEIEIKNKQTEVKNELNKIEKHILTAFNESQPNQINKEWLSRVVNSYYNPIENDEIPTTLLEYFDYFISSNRNDFAVKRLKNINTVKNKIKVFQIFRKHAIFIKDVNQELRNEFIDYCNSERFHTNTTERDLAEIKTVCKHARDLGLETSHQLDKLRMDKVKTDTIYLTLEELELIEKTSFKESLENAKNWLLISCYTAQRISDFMKFNKEMIRSNLSKDGKLISLIEFTQQKTKKEMTIPVHPKVQEIIDKNNGNFPRPISHQKYNEYIKLVCKEAGIKTPTKASLKLEHPEGSGKYRKVAGTYEKWRLVSSHIGRRSFATNHYDKIPTSLLISMTGHSTEKMLLNYIGKSSEDSAIELNNYFK